MRFRNCWHLDTKSHRLFVYSRLTATDPNRVQTGALHASVVHPGFTQWVVPPLVHTQSWTNTWWGEELKIIHFFINWWGFFKGKCLGFFFKKGYKELDLTSGAEVALHGCSRATAGPQKKPYGSKQQVNPGELHLYHVWSACDSSSPFLPSFICFEGSWPWRGGVACTVMWPTDLAVESVSGAIRWEWGGGGVV